MHFETGGLDIKQDMTITFSNFDSEFLRGEFVVIKVIGNKFSVSPKRYWDIKNKPVIYKTS